MLTTLIRYSNHMLRDQQKKLFFRAFTNNTLYKVNQLTFVFFFSVLAVLFKNNREKVMNFVIHLSFYCYHCNVEIIVI